MRAKHFIQVAVVMMVVVGLGFSAAPAPADMISLGSVADSRLIKIVPNVKDGGSGYLSFCDDDRPGSNQGNIQYDLLNFDIASIPTGQVITSAVLKLTIRSAGSGTVDAAVDVYRTTRSWVEANVTWNNADDGTPWATAGGDFVGTTGVRFVNPYATFTVSKTVAIGSVHTVDVTNLVREWYAGTPNYGMELAAATVAGQHFSAEFAPKEDPSAAYRPVLEVTYTPIPEPGTLVLLATGLIGLLCYAWRKRK